LNNNSKNVENEASFLARFSAVSVLVGILGIWGKFTFVPESTSTPCIHVSLHSYHIPLILTMFYLVSLPILKFITPKKIDLKPILKESMILYNVVQVVLNSWMVYRFAYALYAGHPFIGERKVIEYGTTYAIWVHYCDKYLEFLDTYFMVLRGKLDQVSFLHVYHHTTIAWAWWIGLKLMPGGDSYFGALLNSLIHVLMYSYYALSLLKVPCPWKRYLTLAQLVQFISVMVYSVFSAYYWTNATGWDYTATSVQIWEMLSLFILFSYFYKKSYKTNKKVSTSKSTENKIMEQDEDQCQTAVVEITNTTAKAANAAIHVASNESKRIVRSTKQLRQLQ